MSGAIDAAQNAMLAARDLPTAAARSDAARGAVQLITSVAGERSLEREKATEVRSGCPVTTCDGSKVVCLRS